MSAGEVSGSGPELSIIFLEGGRLQAAPMLGKGSSNYRIALPGGGVRRLPIGRALAEVQAAETETLLAAAGERLAQLDIVQLHQRCAGRKLAGRELAQIAFADEHTAGQLAIKAALVAEPGLFICQGDVYQPVPEAQAQAVVAGRRRRAEAAARQQRFLDGLARGEVDERIAAAAIAFIEKRHDPADEAFRVLRRYGCDAKVPIQALVVRWGLVADEHELHLRMALAGMPKVADGDVSCEVDASALPLLAKDAFSIDGAGTLEIDDAFSVTQGKAGTWQLGIHIAAPALGLPAAAQERAEQLMTSVYLPDRKIMQFPESVVHAYALRAGCECPAISLLQDFDPETGRIGPPQLQIGKVQVAANLSLNSFLDWQPGDPGEFSRQLAVLSMFCKQLPSGRNTRALERSFIVRSSSESGLRIIPRQRLAEIDAVVAALMVHYNQAGTERLRAAQAARLLRSAGRNLVRDRGDDRHQEYAWLSSPLRRYIDLLNQQQLIAVLDGRNLPHDADFMRKQALDYDEHAAAARRAQQILERYWAFHWLQPRIGEVFTGLVGKCRRSVHLDDLPVAVKLDKPAVLAEATPVKVRVESVDLGELVGRGKLCA